MTEAKQNFVHWAFQRRAELAQEMFKLTSGKVHRGPFQGMKLDPDHRASDNPLSKLLGVYESEIQEALEHAISNSPDVILNVGAGEGFYAFGLALRTGAPAILVDTDPAALPLADRNAELNGITNYIQTAESTTANFQKLVEEYKHPLVFMDCEGFEDQLLDPVSFPALKHSSIIVESHDCFVPGITFRLIDRFINTHNVQIIHQGSRNPYQDITWNHDDFDKALMCLECRPSTATWLYLVPSTIPGVLRNPNSYYVN
jgi:hypothetical protein